MKVSLVCKVIELTRCSKCQCPMGLGEMAYLVVVEKPIYPHSLNLNIKRSLEDICVQAILCQSCASE